LENARRLFLIERARLRRGAEGPPRHRCAGTLHAADPQGRTSALRVRGQDGRHGRRIPRRRTRVEHALRHDRAGRRPARVPHRGRVLSRAAGRRHPDFGVAAPAL